ncbi:acetyl-CoA--acetoacetyl-CoA transferase subunit alpha [Rhodoplanes sp. TEM]|uniref:Acetyl-CoA--acetoacetyl-CoA transferase subunit alpha n=1 Tax=Rhodoplanes tepidamans TaxID=200616 RepID=A0ABT5JFT6_RHOTP|nr:MULTISPECIES: CoA-transferase [Rhodoplanes]MDC7788574.1 acetyl-CoA--acetoacetyl-CoA transferase subunit alpha [Rhodoplanes tepidamans]MDC7986792.1 acetyl-CoA--acetoacetyl-CoA transferase subunit alpha [Rhodoplanes sp. TEM]MDQ0358556.1 acetate CoA/acetoacetate CoA-transferase alpha subunit [Rhodoplanes tepidamans]
MSKVMQLDDAMRRVSRGSRLMIGEFVGAAEPIRCIEWLVEHEVGDLTLIALTPGMTGGFGKGHLYAKGLVKELISSHVATTTESSDAYLADKLMVRQFYPMGTVAEKVRAGAMGLGGVLVPVGIGILDQPGLFPQLTEPKPKITLNGKEYFVEEALRADVALVKGWRADPLGNVEFRYTSAQNQCDIAMAADYAIVEVNEIVPVGTIPPDRVGIPGPFIDAVVQGQTLAEQQDHYRNHWIKLGRLAPVAA